MKETIKERKSRGIGIWPGMRAIFRDIPLGCRSTEIGIVLRKAWFINSCFCNSEVWSGYSEYDLNDLVVLDHHIFRLNTGSQLKVQVEMFYWKMSQVPIKDVISVKRLLYLHKIINWDQSELIYQICEKNRYMPLF